MSKHPLVAVSATVTLLLAAQAAAQNQTWYVSAARGKGKQGTVSQPAKDLGSIASRVQAGDTICIAAGTYLGRGDSGADKLEVPCRILGGWNEDFSARDPWGASRTIFSGDNRAKNFSGDARLAIHAQSGSAGSAVVVDGIIIDNGARNHYAHDAGALIRRIADPNTGANATPDTQGIHVILPNGGNCVVRDCIVMNTAPSGLTGAIHVHAGEDCRTEIGNNLVINNTGTGIQMTYGGAAKEGKSLPSFAVTANTVLFCWLFEPSASHGGSAMKMDGGARVTAQGNAFAFCDQYAVDNARRSAELVLKDNLLGACALAEYLEFGTRIALDAMEDEAECLAAATGGNVAESVQLALEPQWAASWAARRIVDRAKAEAGAKVENSVENQLRAMFGMNLVGSSVDLSSEVWLHRMQLEQALACGQRRLAGKYGCEAPAAEPVGARPNR